MALPTRSLLRDVLRAPSAARETCCLARSGRGPARGRISAPWLLKRAKQRSSQRWVRCMLFSAYQLARPGRTLIEGHADVRADGALRIHHAFRGEEVFAAVDVAAEAHAFFGDLADVAERMHLEAAAVREDRASQPLNLCSPPACSSTSMPGPQVEVVGVAEHDRRIEVVPQLARMWTAFTAPKCTHGHEHGVGMSPWSVCSTPARALEAGSLAREVEVHRAAKVEGRRGAHPRMGRMAVERPSRQILSADLADGFAYRLTWDLVSLSAEFSRR
jgi:hypothetical protein